MDTRYRSWFDLCNENEINKSFNNTPMTHAVQAIIGKKFAFKKYDHFFLHE